MCVYLSALYYHIPATIKHHIAPPNAVSENTIALIVFKPDAAPPPEPLPESPPERSVLVGDGNALFVTKGGRVDAGSNEPAPPFNVKVEDVT